MSGPAGNGAPFNGAPANDDGLESIFVVLRRDRLSDDPAAMMSRPVTLCYTHMEATAIDAVDEYAIAAFEKAVPNWTPPVNMNIGIDVGMSPLELTSKQWDAINAGAGADVMTWGGRIESDSIFEDDMPLRPDDKDVLNVDGSASFRPVMGRTGDVGELVRIVWSKAQGGGFAEFYFSQATPYIKEELLHETPATRDYEAAFDRGKGQHPPPRGGELLKGPVGDAIRKTYKDQ